MFTTSQRWIATYVVALGAVAVALLVVSSFEVPVLETARFWQALGTLVALGIATETGSRSTLHWAWALGLVVALLHFWYDGFIWSVRRRQVDPTLSG